MADSYKNNELQEPINRTSSFNTYLTYSFINNSLFYPLVPKPYYDYYNRFVRQWFYWYDGYNPHFHNQESGIFSTGIAKVIVDKLAGLINGGRLMYDAKDEMSDFRLKFDEKDKNESDALEFVERWSEMVNFSSKNETAIRYALAGGDSVIKLNSNGEFLFPTVLRKDQYFLDVDFTGKITSFTGVVYTHTRLNKNQDGESEDWYYLLEERRYKEDGTPQYRIYVKAGFGNMTTNKSIDFTKVQDVPFQKIPKTFMKDIKNVYPGVKIDEWNDLPIKSIGIYMYKTTEAISNMPQLPFGESIFRGLEAYLQGYDYYYSNMILDQYIGRGRVLLPRPMQSPDTANTSVFNGLDKTMYAMLDYVDPQNQKPENIQFNLRSEEWMKTRNNLLQMMAMSLNISNRTLATFLDEGVEKATAREISVDDATSTMVENKRRMFRIPINCIIDDILDFHEFPDAIQVRFSRVGLNNMNDAVQQNATMIQNGLTDDDTALRNIHVDKNDKQIEEMKENIKKKQQEQMKQTEPKPKGTDDESYEQENNRDINHVENEEE